jgi:ABC-type dipeptide/oligopeptide/nickel transport system ATPase component
VRLLGHVKHINTYTVWATYSINAKPDSTYTNERHAIPQLVEALSYKPEGCGFDARCPIVSLEFFIDTILPAALWPWE